MSTIPLIPGATHVLKLTPNNALIPSTISNIDNFIKGSLLSNTKFDNWKDIANSASKVGVVDSGSNNEVARYIDPNFNMSTPAGSLWFLGNAEADRHYYLQAGASLSKENSSSVFTAPNYLTSHGFLNASGNPTDRCGNNNGTSLNLSYEEDGEIDVGNGYPDTHNGQVNLGATIDLNSTSNFTISMILKLSDFDGYWFNHYHYIGVFLDSDGINVISPSVGDVNYAFTPADEITLDEFFQVDIVYDGTQTDGDVDTQDLLRYKIYINGSQIALTVASGHCPAETKSAGLGDFVYGEDLANTGMHGVIDEARINLRSFSDNEVAVHYNQWFDTTNYWTVTVQTIITSVTKLDDNSYEISGSGFKPGETNPTGTINGVAFTIDTVTDSSVIVTDNSANAYIKNFLITNSDSESDSYTYTETRSNNMSYEITSPFTKNLSEERDVPRMASGPVQYHEVADVSSNDYTPTDLNCRWIESDTDGTFKVDYNDDGGHSRTWCGNIYGGVPKAIANVTKVYKVRTGLTDVTATVYKNDGSAAVIGLRLCY